MNSTRLSVSGTRPQAAAALAALLLGLLLPPARSAPAGPPLPPAGGRAADSAGHSVPSALTLESADGVSHAPFKVPEGKKAAVVFFISAYCPSSSNFILEMKAIAADFGNDFTFHFIHADHDQKTADIVQHTELHGIASPVLLDPSQKAVRLQKAATTPEAAVVSPDGKTLYQGRINDLYLTPTRRQRQPTTRDLRDVLEAIRHGKSLPKPAMATPAVGCKITLKP